MHRLALLVVVVALTATASAQADPAFAPADSYPQLGSVLPIARAAWPDSRCTGHEMVAIVPAPLMLQGQPTIGVALNDGGCNLLLQDTILTDPVLTCWVVSHEFGHLSGIWEHSTDPANIMSVGSRYQPCSALAPIIPAPTPVVTPVTVPVATQKPVAKCNQKTRKARKACTRKRHKLSQP